MDECAGSVPFTMARLRMIIWAIFLPRSTRKPPSAASSPGSRRRARRQDHLGDALLHHVAGLPGSCDRPDDPRSLGGGELPALGHGHGFSRRRTPCAHRKCAGQLHDAQAHGAESDQKSAGQRLTTPRAQNRRLGRRLPRKPHSRLKPSPDSPAGWWAC